MDLFLLNRYAITGLLVGLNVLAVIAPGRLGTGTANGLVFDVIESSEKLAVGTVHVGLVSGDTDDVENVGGLVEDKVHFFQRAAGGLGEEEVDSGDNGGITVKGEVSTKCGSMMRERTYMTAKMTYV